MMMALQPNRYSNEGRTHDNPGTTRLGKTKSTRVCRIYDPASKFGKRPLNIAPEAWNALCIYCKEQLRVEIMFNKRELESAGLDNIEDWNTPEAIEDMLEIRYRRFGLSVNYKADHTDFTVEKVTKEHPTFVPYARHFFTGGRDGTPPNPRSGSTARFKTYMLENGYDVDVPFERHKYLVHGLHNALQHDLTADLPPELCGVEGLCICWWNIGQ